MRDLIEFGGVIICVFLAAAVVMLAITALVFPFWYVAGTYSCPARWPEQRTEFGVWSGCLVEHGGKMVPEEKLMLNDISVRGGSK